MYIIGVGTAGAAGAAAPQLFAIELNSNFEIYVNFYK